MLLYLEPGPKL